MEMAQGLPESLGAPIRRLRRESSGFAPQEGGIQEPSFPARSWMISYRELGAAGLGEPPVFPVQTPWRIGENRDKPQDFHGEIFLPSFWSTPPVKMYQAGSSKLENLMGQWESSQLADKSPQWEQPVLFPKLPFIPRARKYPQIPLASPFLSHKAPFPPLKSFLLPPKMPSLSCEFYGAMFSPDESDSWCFTISPSRP